MERSLNKRAVYAWAFYDWANSAYTTVVMAGFFPIFFRGYWAGGLASRDITFYLGLANSLASLVIVLIAPLLGAIADRGGARKQFLFVFAALGVIMTGGLFWIGQGQWELAALLYAFATIGFLGGNVFYDALLIDLAPREKYDNVSALGYALGYLGGGLLFALCVLMSLFPAFFGLADTAQAVRISFILVALWWAAFAAPLFLLVRDPAAANRTRGAFTAGWRQLHNTFRHIRQLHGVVLFLIAYWLYIDGVTTIVVMAVDYGQSLGFGSDDLILALLITQFVGFPAAIAFGWLGGRIGTKRGIFIAIGVYILATTWGATMEQVWEFYLLAAVIGLVQGGIQSLSRAFYARLIPADRAAEFFGFYNVLGKFAAVIGPLLVGWIGVLTGNPRLGLLSVISLFIAGAVLLAFVDGGVDNRREAVGERPLP